MAGASPDRTPHGIKGAPGTPTTGCSSICNLPRIEDYCLHARVVEPQRNGTEAVIALGKPHKAAFGRVPHPAPASSVSDGGATVSTGLRHSKSMSFFP
ncbi:hypothetical protein QC764_0056160 [Podospora pseudoanserina]|uniref:Uncharacterized protein n=1 Tax=Podospora pseudoanserina TaxID=2609844 RepID=A0ABR0IDQ0_9PEZI|nr:hypothetical protein QC764_0056160 [Podospora pseudoanserina]